MEFEQLREIASEFENILKSALEQKYGQYQPEIREHLLEVSPVRRWHLGKFLDTYMSAGSYPTERLERLIYKLFDIKLQLYYILEVDLGLYNRLVYDRGYDKDNSLALPHVFLTRLSLDQSLIAKSRILWERIMNFVFYLENGEELEEKVSGRRSKRKVFFDFSRGNLRWRFLEPYESVLQEYEDSYRAPRIS